MRYRVTAIAGGSEDAALGNAAVALEDMLNAAPAARTAVASLDQLTLVLVSGYDDAAENARWASSRDTQTGVRNPITGERLRHVSLGVPVDRAIVSRLKPVELQRTLARAIVDAVATRRDGVATGLDHRALAATLRTVLLPHG